MLLLTSILSGLVAVGIHYETILLATATVRRMGRLRHRIAIAVVIVLIGHLIEIAAFAIAWSLLLAAGYAELSVPPETFSEVAYFSGSVYTSLGFGDVVPIGRCGLFAVLEAVTGLVLIAWTASFTFLHMRDLARPRGGEAH